MCQKYKKFRSLYIYRTKNQYIFYRFILLLFSNSNIYSWKCESKKEKKKFVNWQPQIKYFLLNFFYLSLNFYVQIVSSRGHIVKLHIFPLHKSKSKIIILELWSLEFGWIFFSAVSFPRKWNINFYPINSINSMNAEIDFGLNDIKFVKIFLLNSYVCITKFEFDECHFKRKWIVEKLKIICLLFHNLSL